LRFWAEIQDTTGNIIGEGPVNSLTRCTTRTRVNRVGEYSFEMAATDPRASLVTARRTALIYGMLGGQKTFLGGGPIDKVATRLTQGAPLLTVAGSDLLAELSRVSIGKMDLNAGGDTNIQTLMTFIDTPPLAWSSTREAGSPDFIARLVYETTFNTLFAVAEKTGAYFRFDTANAPARGLEWFYAIQDSGILATMHGDPVAIEGNPNACLITNIEIDQDSSDLKTRAFFFGSGEGDSITTAIYAQNWPDFSS
jgi:hypothetical protein